MDGAPTNAAFAPPPGQELLIGCMELLVLSCKKPPLLPGPDMMDRNDSGRSVSQSILSSAAAGRPRTVAGLFIRSMSCSPLSEPDPARRGQSASEEVITGDQVNNAHLKKLLISFLQPHFSSRGAPQRDN